MKIILCFFCLLIFPACSDSSTEHSKEKMQSMEEKKLPVSDFNKLKSHQLPESEKEQSVDMIAKIYFQEVEDMRRNHFMLIDLQSKIAQNHPRTGHFYGDMDFDIKLTDADVESIVTILKDSQFRQWKKFNTYKDEENADEATGLGFNWTILIQYTDGTMYRKRGEERRGAKVVPEGYETFVRELPAFIDSKYAALDDTASSSNSSE